MSPFEIVGKVVATIIVGWFLFGFFALASMKMEIPREVALWIRLKMFAYIIATLPYVAMRCGTIPKGVVAVRAEDVVEGQCPCPVCRAERGE